MELAAYHIGQWLILFLGITAVVLSMCFIQFFRTARKNKRMAFTMQLFLGEQIVTSVGTLLFSINSLASSFCGERISDWNDISPGTAILIRAAMFGAMILSTTKLSMEVSRLSKED